MNANTCHSSTIFSTGNVVAVLVPLAGPGLYDYRVGDEAVGEGGVVMVPLGKRHVHGVVWGKGATPADSPKLKTVAEVLDVPLVPPVVHSLVDWVAGYTMAPKGMVLKMVVPVPSALAPERGRDVVALGADWPASVRITPARAKVREVAACTGLLSASDLAREAGVGQGVVREMIKTGLLTVRPGPRQAGPPPPDVSRPGPALSPVQRAAADTLIAKVDEGFSATLIDGVTGSGKTEVYLEAVAAAVKAGHQALVLLPEIALSVQWLDRFRRRFGADPALWHSDLGEAERRATWRHIASGEAKVVVGARSALFLPYPDLGLVVVDEEHDGAFKQEEGVCYHARDMAVVRAKLGAVPVVLVSATPSVETQVNVDTGRYGVVHLPDRHGGAVMPIVESVDMRADPPPRGRWLAPKLVEAIARTFEQGEQAMLFLNRRGYAPLTLCRACGHRLQCPDCSAWLVEHRSRGGRLICHHCGHAIQLPSACPECGTEDSFTACGPGIERIAEEAATLFPDARVAIMASDTLSGPKAAARLVEDVASHSIDLLVGTQIMAKGHHFPGLTLVGVVDADLGLDGADLRAGERTWQLLSQVAGRAGRADRPGRVLMQTWQPDHPILKSLAQGDRQGFMAREISERKLVGMPPFGRLAAVIVSGSDGAAVDGFCRALARVSPDGQDGIEVFGPAPAPLALLRGRHRRRFLLKTAKAIAPQPILAQWLDRVKATGDIRVQVDIDPYSFF